MQITQELKKQTGPKLKDFREYLSTEVRGVWWGGRGGGRKRACTPTHPPARPPPPHQVPPAVAELRSEVEHFAKQFPTIGFEKASMRYKD